MKAAISIIAALVCAAACGEAPSSVNETTQGRVQTMNRIDGLLSASKAFFLATVDGDQPKLRPLGAFLETDGKLLFGVGDFKNVYRQMTVNPLVELVACKPNGHWLRYTGRAVFETDETYAAQMIKESGLEAIYNEQTGNKLMVFHLEDATAVEIAVMGEGENLL